MPEVLFHTLSPNDRRDALEVAASQSGRPAYLLEKDIWVVHALRLLFDAPFGKYLAFKGGTSLSKAYKAIRRFSEDVDITYDIRVIAPDLASEINKDSSLTRSQSDKWRKKIRRQLNEQVCEQILTSIEEGLSRSGLPARVYVSEESSSPTLRIDYSPLFDDYSFVKSEVMIEFDARATGEPREERIITCDAAEFLPDDVKFPSARTSVLLAERTFLEKATAIHVFCLQERRRGERLSRHWHDLVRLDNAGYADKALANRQLAFAVARHKAMFFPENGADGKRIDYHVAVSGGLRLIPSGEARKTLADDYARMVEGGILLDDTESFDQLMEQCVDIEAKVNDSMSRMSC